jgi:hypothetical protein
LVLTYIALINLILLAFLYEPLSARAWHSVLLKVPSP